jgi:hypothetical protein
MCRINFAPHHVVVPIHFRWLGRLLLLDALPHLFNGQPAIELAGVVPLDSLDLEVVALERVTTAGGTRESRSLRRSHREIRYARGPRAELLVFAIRPWFI